MTTPDEIRTFHERLHADDELRQRALQRVRCDAYERDGLWYAGVARVRTGGRRRRRRPLLSP